VVCIFCVEMPGLSNVAQRSLGDGRVLMDSCRAGASSGIMVASTVGQDSGFASVCPPGDELVESGGDDF
jgi:hypothetical protein